MRRSYIVDRIEGSFAVCEEEDGTMENISLEKIKGDIRDGVILLETCKGYFRVDEEKTKEREKEVQDFMKGMWSDEE
ncbi:DUF3006 domain-containing protein [Clostridium cadaveris]|uniref:DUF3006 domain-containing protein n=1 Tax=Clostridium cadaveris TaxID=1529 RepID=UPI0031D5853D